MISTCGECRGALPLYCRPGTRPAPLAEPQEEAAPGAAGSFTLGVLLTGFRAHWGGFAAAEDPLGGPGGPWLSCELPLLHDLQGWRLCQHQELPSRGDRS